MMMDKDTRRHTIDAQRETGPGSMQKLRMQVNKHIGAMQVQEKANKDGVIGRIEEEAAEDEDAENWNEDVDPWAEAAGGDEWLDYVGYDYFENNKDPQQEYYNYLNALQWSLWLFL